MAHNYRPGQGLFDAQALAPMLRLRRGAKIYWSSCFYANLLLRADDDDDDDHDDDDEEDDDD